MDSQFQVGRRRKARATVAVAVAAGGLAMAAPALASEYGLSPYALGSQTSMAGFTPPPGIFVTDTVISYQGDADDTLQLPLGARLAAGVDEEVLVNALTIAVFPDVRLGSGQIGFAATLPYGRVGVDAAATFVGPLGLPGGAASDEETAIGDLQLAALIGWKDGVHNWNLSGALVLPTGEYDSARLANVGLNRTAFDAKGAYTYMNPGTGREFSAGAGFTFNGENKDTDYQSGTDFHLEGSFTQHLPSGWALGVGGYFYQQITGDSGSGARLGDFKGRVGALGPMVSYTFMIGPAPVQLSGRWYREFGAENRAEGDTVMFGVSMPIAAFGAPPAN
ncbi:MAG TPA: transporter [Caulobacter sp.]|nr:transporter [Caulobacter sp.]